MSFTTLVQEFIADARLRASGGLTFEEVGKTFVDFLYLAVQSADSILDIAGPEKKKLVMDAFAALWTAIEPFFPVPMTWKLFWLMSKYFLWKIAYAVAAGAVESILKKLRTEKNRNSKILEAVVAQDP